MVEKRQPHERLNIYMDDAELRTAVRIEAARRGITVSAFCVQAIRRYLAEAGAPTASPGVLTPTGAAAALDEIRGRIGPLGVPVAELVAEGRYR